MNIINLTPHEINIYNADKELLMSVPSTGEARCATIKTEIGKVDGVSLFETTYGEISGLPDSSGEGIIVVSFLVRQALPNRVDLFSPGELIRNETGQPVGCIGLSR